MTDADPVRLERRESTLVITIDRPQARNAVNPAVAEGVSEGLRQLEEDDALGAGVLTGAGGTFSAGMDLKAFAAGQRPVIGDRGFAGLTNAEIDKPLIAAVEGWAMGGGFEMALACDLVVAADTARFGLPEVKRGLVAGAGGVFRLPRRLPHHVAMEVMLTGQPLEAARAEHFGLVNRVVAEGRSVDAALELAGAITPNAPLALKAVKDIVRRTTGMDDSAAFAEQGPFVERLRSSDDAAEGARAFAEKRSPDWRGR